MIKALRNIVACILALLLVVLIALQFVLNPSRLTGIVNKYAPRFVEGNVEFSQIRARVITSFPYLTVEAENFALTYPHSRYEAVDTIPSGRLSKAGMQRDSSGVDTLASAARLAVKLNYISLFGGRLDMRKAELARPRIFAHQFGPDHANWDILPLGGDESSDDGQDGSMGIIIHRISLEDRPLVIYTNPADTISLLATARRIALDGKLDLQDIFDSKTLFRIDTMLVSGRLPADTLSLGIERVRAGIRHRNASVEADARAYLFTGSHGRMRIPIHIEADASMGPVPEGEFKADIRSFKAAAGAVVMEASGMVHSHAEGTGMDLTARIDNCPVGEIMKDYRENFPVLKKLDTDARLSLEVRAQGTYSEESMPAVDAKLLIPSSRVYVSGIGREGRLALDAELTTGSDGTLDARVKQLLMDVAGAGVTASATARDILGEDPSFALEGKLRARVDTLTRAFLDGIEGTGDLQASLSAKARLSQLDMEKIGGADIACTLTGENLRVDIPSDSIVSYISRAEVSVGTKGALSLRAHLDTVNASVKDSIFVRGRDILLQAGKSADLTGLLTFRSLGMRDLDGLALAIKDGKETFSVKHSDARKGLSLASYSGGIAVRTEGTSALMKDFQIDLSARQHVRKRRNTMSRRTRMERREPEQPDEFADADISLSLSSSLQELARKWDFEGGLSLGSALVRMEGMPLRTSVSDVRGHLTKNELTLENISLKAGNSDISANARVSGLRRLILGYGKPHLKVDAALTSEYVDAGQLLSAFGSSSEPREEASPSESGSSIVVLPSNLDVNLTFEASRIKYDTLRINWAAADVIMKERTLQITNALAASNMGDLYLEGFYSTRTKDGIKAGFDLNIVDIAADKVLTLFPDIRREMPMIESFSGNLDLEIAATTLLDTTMNVVMPSLNGIIRMSGKDLTLKESKEFTKIARMLMFRDKKKAVIDNMSVTGMIKDNVLEVFPFVLGVDRYQMAASGQQVFDSKFRYHISVIRSPLLVKFGLNAWGDDFDHIRYGLGRALYTNPNVPVFTKELDEVQYNLVAAIHNVFELGVEKAMAETSGHGIAQGKADAQPSEEELSSAGEDVNSRIQRVGSVMADITARSNASREVRKNQVISMLQE